MIDPTALQTARLHIGHIRVLWPTLDDARTTRRTGVHGPLSGRAAQARDADLRAERADRDAAQTYRALATTAAPANLAVVDAEVEALATITATVWAVRSDLRQWSRLVPVIPAAVDGKLSWLTDMLDATSAEVVDQAAAQLTRAARGLARALDRHLDEDWRPAHRRCPACGQRALYIWDHSPSWREATVECRGEVLLEGRDHPTPCRCDGDDCPCKRPGARPKSRHLWPA